MRKDSLGDRMKGYENINRNYLTKRVPVIIRLDGKSFHTFTKGLNRPFDDILISTMQETARYLCENIQGCKIAYTQSDEITLLLTDYDSIDTQGWFEYNIQKMVSISSSMATLQFNRIFEKNIKEWNNNFIKNGIEMTDKQIDYFYLLNNKLINGAIFDSRVFSIPKEEVNNCFVWRQQDATRNSIQTVGQSNFSHKHLHKKSCNMIQDMLFKEKGINWNDYETPLKRGTCIVKEEYLKETDKESVMRTRWIIDKNIPIFSEDKNYIEQYVFLDNNKKLDSIFDNMSDKEFEDILNKYGFKYEKVEPGKGEMFIDGEVFKKIQYNEELTLL